MDPDKDQTIEWLKTTINVGTYYIKVEAMGDGQTDYYLRCGLTAPEEQARQGKPARPAYRNAAGAAPCGRCPRCGSWVVGHAPLAAY